jgi:hypothetical protein
VITLSLLLQNAAGQLNTLVNFESALPCLGGQFSVGANKVSTYDAELMQLSDAIRCR